MYIKFPCGFKEKILKGKRRQKKNYIQFIHVYNVFISFSDSICCLNPVGVDFVAQHMP
jgi:hypothetical protein